MKTMPEGIMIFYINRFDESVSVRLEYIFIAGGRNIFARAAYTCQQQSMWSDWRDAYGVSKNSENRFESVVLYILGLNRGDFRYYNLSLTYINN